MNKLHSTQFASGICVILALTSPPMRESFRSDTNQTQTPTLNTKSPDQDIHWSLKQVGTNGDFEILVKNESNEPVAINRDVGMFDIRIYSKSGRLLSDFPTFKATTSGIIRDSDWVVLWPGDSIGFIRCACSRSGKMTITSDAEFADCIEYRYLPQHEMVPGWVLETKARIVHMNACARIPLKSDIKPEKPKPQPPAWPPLTEWMRTKSDSTWQNASFRVDATRYEPLYYVKKGESTSYRFMVNVKRPNFVAIRSINAVGKIPDRNAAKELVSIGKTVMSVKLWGKQRAFEYLQPSPSIGDFGASLDGGTRRQPPEICALDLIFPYKGYSQNEFVGSKSTPTTHRVFYKSVVLNGETIVEWELTVDRKSRLPMGLVEYRTEKGSSRLKTMLVKYSQWQFDTVLPADTFSIQPPPHTRQIAPF